MVERHDSDGVLIYLLYVARAASITAGENGGFSDFLGITIVGEDLIKWLVQLFLILVNPMESILINRAKEIHNELLE
jgi:hypothetical protein